MMAAIFPLGMLSEQANLLTAIVLGFGFGFALERAGFGSPRKLAAQFYLYDMSVFKVMFTAILVAMVGFYAGAAFGWVDLGRMWIVPTFIWAQLVGGFLLGVGFILSGLCPGTAVVSLASGRVDAAVAFAGVVFGTLLFALLIGWFPGIQRLYDGGSLGTSVLAAVLRVPAPWLALGVVVMAGAAFAGAEKVERRFQAARAATGAADAAPVASPAADPRQQAAARHRWVLVGTLAAVAMIAGFMPARRAPVAALRVTTVEPLQLAEAIIAGEPDLLLVDLRAVVPGVEVSASIPGALRPVAGQTAASLVEGAAPGTRVIVFDADGTLDRLTGDWPHGSRYEILRGGFQGWRREVLTPRSAQDAVPEELAAVQRQNGIANFFSGAPPAPVRQLAPPPAGLPAGGGKPKKAGGC